MTDKSVVAKPVHFIESATRKVRFAEPVVLTNLHLDAFQRGDPVPGAVEQPSNPLNLETSDLDPITPEEDALATAIIAATGLTRQSLHGVVRAIRDGLVKAGAVIVPVEPTEAMIEAWGDASFSPDAVETMTDAEVNAACARTDWQAMIAASAHSIQSGGEGGEAK